MGPIDLVCSEAEAATVTHCVRMVASAPTLNGDLRNTSERRYEGGAADRHCGDPRPRRGLRLAVEKLRENCNSESIQNAICPHFLDRRPPWVSFVARSRTPGGKRTPWGLPTHSFAYFWCEKYA